MIKCETNHQRTFRLLLRRPSIEPASRRGRLRGHDGAHGALRGCRRDRGDLRAFYLW